MGDSEEQLDNSLEVEWAKSKARRDRWEEEVPLLVEEMSRVIRFHKWKAGWWRRQGKRRKKESADILHGVNAYAEKQAAIQEQLAQSSAIHWYPALVKNGIVPEWAEEYAFSPLEEDATTGGTSDTEDWEEDDVEEIDDHFVEGDEQDEDATDIIDFFEDDD
jgi:hypothetical protein